MKQGSNSRRSRGRGNNNKRSSSRNSNHDSGGQEGRIRGNASQVYEKYLALARDALSADDRISSENYSQHAEHFYRLMTINAENQKKSPSSGSNNGQNQEEKSGQKDRSRNQRSRNNNRGNNREKKENVDAIENGKTVDETKKSQVIEEDTENQTKIVKEIKIKSSTKDQSASTNNKENTLQDTESK
ncbi:MAG: DUF4167 domain-containing protein [Pseudomonadota bacterium]|nr:DUF4167 domain-containing protein [Pseudomonadota bacterium]